MDCICLFLPLFFFWIKLSIVVSTDAVASSNTRIFLLYSKTLTKQTSCLCPTLQFSPSSATHALRSPLSCPTIFARQHMFNTSSISWSECSPRGSKLVLMVPWNNVGSWEIMLKRDLKSFKPILLISTPLVSIWPFEDSTTRKRAWINVDFPLPVMSTKPIFFSPGKAQVILLRTIGRVGVYWTWRLSRSILPLLGHSRLGL